MSVQLEIPRSIPDATSLDATSLDRKRPCEDTSKDEDDCFDFKRRRALLTKYPQRVQKQVTQLVSDILVSIYYDINYVCIVRATCIFENKADTADLLGLLIGQIIDPERYQGFDPRGTVHRMGEFVVLFGWKMLSICITAEGFRRAVREISHGGTWGELLGKIRENQWSLELRPYRKMWSQHPHHVVQSINKKVRRPCLKGEIQIHVDNPVFDPDSENWKAKGQTTDPTLRRTEDGDCDLCGLSSCDCEIDFSAGSLVELVERPLTGTGVRALTSFRAGDILGQFIGEIQPTDYDDDEVYALTHVSKVDMEEPLAIISPKKYGNWTRYIAHSCDASCEFRARTVGKHTVMTVEAKRNIVAGEDITVNYGTEYWENKQCMCGEVDCLSKKAVGEE
ncbi:SET domain protein [Aspergillus foveolatus]|uniref:SET domain protein n=1 Tax=Aspergillus foveolatus TaxID=210207 RepID=UPI003CCD1E70